MSMWTGKNRTIRSQKNQQIQKENQEASSSGQLGSAKPAEPTVLAEEPSNAATLWNTYAKGVAVACLVLIQFSWV